MLHPLSRLLNDKILSLRHGGPIARVAGLIIDPRTLHISGLLIKGDHVPEEIPVIDTTDVREISSAGLIIDSEDKIHELNDLIRLQKIANENFSLIGIGVYLESQTKIGKVIDATFHPTAFYIHQLVVQPTLLRALLQSTTIINRSQIISITPKAIIIKEATIKDEEIPHHAIRAVPAK